MSSASFWRRPTLLLVVSLGVALSAFVAWAMQHSLVDDSYITLVYARVLAFHGQWGLIPGMPANTATSPLNVMILALFTFVFRSPMVALWIVTILNGALLAVGLVLLGDRWRVGTRLAWVGLPLIVLNPLLASSLGLETTLVVTWTVFALAVAADGRAATFGWLSGVGVVLRPDLVLVALIIWAMHPTLRRPEWKAASWATLWRALLVGMPWYVFSWFYFGSAVPDTLIMKTASPWGSYISGMWTRYHVLYPLAIDAVLLIAALGLLALVALPFLVRGLGRELGLSVAAPGVAGIVYFVVYWRIDVPPYFWYYGLPIAGLTLPLAFAIAILSRRAVAPGRILQSRTLAGILTAVVLVPVVLTWGHGLLKSSPLRDAPVHGNAALPYQYEQLGLDLPHRIGPHATVRSAGEFGTMLYYCNCRLLDRFNERALIMGRLLEARRSSWLMRLNYLWLDPARYPTVQQDYHLFYGPGHRDRKGGWNVWSPTRGDGHFDLRPGPSPDDLRHGLAP